MRIGYVKIGGSSDKWHRYAADILGAACHKTESGLIIDIDPQSRIYIEDALAEDIVSIGWDVGSDVELDTLKQTLASKGMAMGELDDAAESTDKAGVSVWAPDGLQHNFYVRRDKHHSDVPPELAERFVAGGLGLGHMAIASGNARDAVSFYEDIIGMRISDYIDFSFGEVSVRVAFFRCNQRHHSIALIPMDMAKKLNHLMLEYKDIDDLGRRYDLAKQSEYPIVTGLGRHANDRMISFYQQSPSGFDIECGYGGLLVEEQGWTVAIYDKAAIWGHQDFRAALVEGK